MGFRLSNPTYSPPEISHMIQTCWLPDPNERPTFTTLKQITWECLSAFVRTESNANQFNFTSSINDEMHTRYKMIKSCNPVYQKQNNSENKDEYIQGYADLEMPRVIESSNIRPTVDKCMVEYSGESEEESPLKDLIVINKHRIQKSVKASSKWVRVYIRVQAHQ